MDPSRFGERSPGRLVAIDGGEVAFAPAPLPADISLGREELELLGEAKGAIGEIRGLTVGENLPDPTVLLRPLQMEESLRSSSLEGTYATDEELLLYELDLAPEGSKSSRTMRQREVSNLRRTLLRGEALLGERDLRLFDVRALHQTLLTGVRGDEKQPGAFRKGQVFIGVDHRFAPPPGHLVEQCMQDLEAYWCDPRDDLPHLMRALVVHYQFEAIHPFLDGNGRIGRALLSLMIARWCGLERPWLYLSAFFEDHRDEYIHRLFQVSASGDWSGWIQFGLHAMIEQGADTVRRCRALLALRQRWITSIREANLKTRVLQLVDTLFAFPIINVERARRGMGVRAYQTARSDLEQLAELGILQPMQGVWPLAFRAGEVSRIAHSREFAHDERASG